MRKIAGRGYLTNLREEAEKLTWAHTIDLGDGVITRGIFGHPNRLIMKAFSQVDFAGKKVLDIGCWDGLWSFEAEKRGAKEVYATDYISQRWGGTETFLLAHKALNSRAQYYPDVSVYDVGQKLGIHDFDVVLYCGVYYHLKNPLLALARLRDVTKDGGVIIVEGEVLPNWVDSYASFYYNKSFGNDQSNWWVPTAACLKQWVESSYFEILNEYGKGPPGVIRRLKKKLPWLFRSTARMVSQRYALTARAIRRKDPKYVYPDEDLKQFDSNQYS